jgi:hypothetical protein
LAVDPVKFAVGRMAHRLASGYYAFLVGQYVAANPKAINSLPPPTSIGQSPTGDIARKDGSFHTFDLRYYLDLLREDQSLQTDFARAWAAGVLLNLSDELSKPEHRYFDHAPILELVYHLRNAVAHGNRFSLNANGLKRLTKYPAHNRLAAVKSPLGTIYEIDPSLTGRVLFDFMGAADIIDILQSVEIDLCR